MFDQTLIRVCLILGSFITAGYILRRVRHAKVQIEDTIFWLMFSAALLILAACGGYLCAFWGCGDKLLIALAVMMGLDYLSGVLLAIVERKLSSQIGFSGIMKKALIMMLVGAANLMDLYVLDNSNLLHI